MKTSLAAAAFVQHIFKPHAFRVTSGEVPVKGLQNTGLEGVQLLEGDASERRVVLCVYVCVCVPARKIVYLQQDLTLFDRL